MLLSQCGKVDRMSRRSERRVKSIALAAALMVAAASLPGYTGALDEAPSAPSITEDEAIREDALQYSRDYGVDVHEAERRLRLQPSFHGIVHMARDAHPGEFAGAWTEHTPEYELVIAFTSPASDLDDVRQLIATNRVPARIESDAAHSEQDLLKALAKLDAMLTPTSPAATRGIDVASGALVVGGEIRDEPTIAALAATLHVPIKVEPGERYRQTHTYGGARLRHNGLDACTSGFTIRNTSTGVHGVLTAGHCPNPLSYWQPDTGQVYGLTLMGERADDHKDAQWHIGSGHGVYAQFWDGDSLRNQSRNVARLDMPGDYVCHFGIRTGYSCGTIQTIHFDPGDACGFDGNDPCAATWVLVEGPNLACSGGDSGGPWFNANSMYGLQTHGDFFGTEPGHCRAATLMSLGFLSEMTLETLKAS